MLHIDDIEWLRADCSSLEHRCPICGTAAHHKALLAIPHMRTGTRMELFKCTSCNTCFYPHAVESSYDESDAASTAFLQHYLESGAGLWEMFWPIARVHQPSKSRLLDVGCGFGFSVHMWRNIFGADAIGVETAEWGQIGCAQLDIPVYKGMLDEISILQGRTFDIVYACEVIEHVADPRAFLKSLSSRVGQEGTLILTTPCGDFIEEGNDEKDILAALLPGDHLFLLSAQAFELLLNDAGFPHVHVISARERLIAYASRSPIDLEWSEQEVRRNYIEYLRRQLSAATPGTPFHDGFAYRLFKEMVAHGDLKNAYEVDVQLTRSMAIRFGANETTPSAWVDRSMEAASFDHWAKELPFFIGSYCFFRGELGRISGENRSDVLAWLTASIEIGLNSLKISPLFFTEAIHLMWAAMNRSMLIYMETNRPVDGFEMFSMLAEARSGGGHKFQGAKPELDMVLESALMLLPSLLETESDEVLLRFSVSIDHALEWPSTDKEAVSILQTLSSSIHDLLRFRQVVAMDPTVASPHIPALAELRNFASSSFGHLGESLSSTTSKLLTYIVTSVFSQAVAQHQAGRLDDAEILYGKVISIDRNHVDAVTNLGIINLQKGKPLEALHLFELSLNLNPNQPDVLTNYGNLLFDLKRLDEALASYERAVELEPNYAEAYNNRGITLHDMGRLDEALASYERAVELEPSYAEAYNNRGITLHDMGRLDEALASYERATTLEPNYVQAHNNCGKAFHDLNRPDEALASYERAIALKPDYAEAYSNLGNVLRDLAHLDKALANYERAIALKPDYAEAYYNRSNVLKDMKRLDEALASCERAITLKPNYDEAYWNKSLLLLMTGEYAQGWPLYEWRWKQHEFKPLIRNFEPPLWLGKEDLHDKTILLYAEQGLGDSLQFCRYAPLVEAKGAKVILEMPPPLVNLMGSLSPTLTIIAKGNALPPFDYHCPLMSLPFAFQTRADSIPAKQAYLSASNGQTQLWHEKLGERKRQRIGLAWSGNPSHKNDQNRSISLSNLLPLLELDLEFHCLHKEIREDDIDSLEKLVQIKNWGTDLKDFSDTAALISEMDLVISVDTSVAHLGAAMGKPTWVLLPFISDFRWLADREDSPWYPTIRLFRQPQPKDWPSVIRNVVKALGNN